MNKKIYLLDVAGYVYRSYYALPRMTNSQGESTHALYGFTRSLLRIIKDFNPEYIAAIFDGVDNKKLRTEIYADYKSTRAKAPEDLPHQMMWAQEICRLYGIPFLSIEGVEADDTMGTIVKWAAGHGFESYLCTGDKDLCQLVSDHVFVLQTHKENLLLDAKKVEEVYGVPPRLIVDYLALIGDQSDNIPGVPGIGPKTAVSLLQQFGSLENLLANVLQVPGKKKQELLLQESEMALLSKRLAIINCNVDIPIEPEFFRRKETLEGDLIAFFRRMNFNALLKELPQPASADKQQPILDVQVRNVDYQLVDDEKALQALGTELEKASQVCFDTETTDVNPILAELVGIGFALEAGRAWYVPVNGELGLERVVRFLKPLFANPKIGFYAHHAKYDLHVLQNYGIKVANLSFDTMLASYLLHSHSHRHSLEHLAMHYLGFTKTSIKNLIEKDGKKITMAEAPIHDVKEYCCLDVDLTCQLKERVEDELNQRQMMSLYKKLELPLVKVLLHVERNGIYIDVPYLKEMSTEVAGLIAQLEQEIYALAGEEFNLNSPKQMGHILYTKLGIKAGKKTATGQASTNADVLEFLAREHPIAQKILDYRTLEKLRSTYIEKLVHDINPATHRIHCTFNQTMAATGRLSCQDPNLQNIPTRTEIGSRIRQAFKPEKSGWSFIAADYSQIELRILAHLSEDPQLITAFCNDEDIHAYTASLIFNVPLKEVTKQQRYQAKAVNFGIVYGQQAYGLAQEVGTSVKEASLFIDAYFKRYHRVKEFIEECKAEARLKGKTVTMLGRERLIPDMNSKNSVMRNAAERLAINTPLQGSAADLIKKAMLDVDALLLKEQKLGFMTLQIHDELLFEVPDFELMDLQHSIKKMMENVFTLKVPLKVDIAVGKNWKEC